MSDFKLTNINLGELLRSNGRYQKEIVVDKSRSESTVIERIHDGYKFFIVKHNKKAVFRLKVNYATNTEATERNVYWVAQADYQFKTSKWWEWEYIDERGVVIEQEERDPLHELLNELNKNSPYKHGPKYTAEDTGFVGKNYTVFTENRGSLNFQHKAGVGFWVEGINYRPEHNSQGAFIIAVGEPQIFFFYVEKKVGTESVLQEIINEFGAYTQEDTEEVEQTLIYGDYLQLHLGLHNISEQYDYATVDVYDKNKKMGSSRETISLRSLYNSKNPSSRYNINILEDLLVDLRWADQSGHKEGKNNEDSIKIYTLLLVLHPKRKYGKTIQPLERKVTFRVNYKGSFSFDVHEPQYVAQVVKIKQPPLVSQSFELCKYTEIKLTYEDTQFILLKEGADGSLQEDNKTPFYQFVAGNDENRKEITIDVGGLDVKHCENDKFSNDIFHPDNHVFNTQDANKNKSITTHKNMFSPIFAFSEVDKTDTQLKFKAGYPYRAASPHTFLFAYLTFQIDPVPIDISINSCRYVRTPKFMIYPDIEWAVHLNYDPDTILYYKNEEVALVKGHPDYMSYIIKTALWVNDKLRPFVEDFIIDHINTPALKKKWNKIQYKLKGYDYVSLRDVAFGFHAKYDNSKIINYAKIDPFRIQLHYIIYQMVMFSLAIDVLMILLTGGAGKLGKVAKTLKKIKQAKKAINNFKKANSATILTPRISANFGIRREQQYPEFGKIGTIIDFTIKASPFIEIYANYPFIPDKLLRNSRILKELRLLLQLGGKITYDYNISYNTLTKKFTLNDNAKHQKTGGNRDLKDGDLVAIGGRIGVKAIASGVVSTSRVILNIIPVHARAEIDGIIGAGVGVTLKFGIDDKGPYLDFIVFLDEIKLKYSYKVQANTVGVKLIKKEAKDKELQLYKGISGSFLKIHLFDVFKTKDKLFDPRPERTLDSYT